MKKLKLTLEQAEEIMQNYGKFLELTSGAMIEVFYAKIPSSFLPYPPEVIEKALITLEKHWAEAGHIEIAETIAKARAFLIRYSDVETSLQELKDRLDSPNIKWTTLAGKHQQRLLNDLLKGKQ